MGVVQAEPTGAPFASAIQAIKDRLPAPAKPAARAVRRVLYREPRSRLALVAFKWHVRRRYGPGVVYTVHDDDEMFRFIREFWSWRFHVVKMRIPSDAMRTYLVSGAENLTDLEAALRHEGRELSQLDSFLEFASGFGRFTRFLVMRLDPSRVTVADINPLGVDFARRSFGVSGFYSTETATDLDHDRKYEVVFVASLFSHLAIDHWRAWLRRLYELVAPGGLLVFSTHGPYARDVVFGDTFRDQLEIEDEGFTFLRSNETGGRLDVGYYGSAFVTEEFVTRQVTADGLGTVKHVYPHKLWGTQDLYFVEKPASQN